MATPQSICSGQVNGGFITMFIKEQVGLGEVDC